MTLNLTPLRLRVLQGLEQRGPMCGQDLAYEFATIRRETRKVPFNTPQAATRWSGAFMKPLVKAGLVLHWGSGRGGEYRVSDRGKRCARHPTDAADGGEAGR